MRTIKEVQEFCEAEWLNDEGIVQELHLSAVAIDEITTSARVTGAIRLAAVINPINGHPVKLVELSEWAIVERRKIEKVTL